jgi:hypothetical protein
LNLNTEDWIMETTVEKENSRSVNFPALGFNQGWLYPLDSMDEIRRSSRRGFEKGLYKNLLLVDSSGNSYDVVGGRKIRTVVKFSVSSLLGLLTGNPSWEVEFTFAPRNPSKISVDEVKRLIFACFKKNGDYWEEMTHFKELRDRIAAADSLERVFAVFREFHQL